jgi:arylsulfatase A-like enzyme
MESHSQRGKNISRRQAMTRMLGCSLAAWLGGSACKRPVRPANVVLILIDDLGWRDVSYMGSHFYETPAVDRLAREGIQFSKAYACAPNCAPTRACLFTGQYTPRHGIYTVGTSARGESRYRKLVPIENRTVLDPDSQTFPKLLARSGYRTGFMGKWHLGTDPATGPLAHGFDINIGGYQAGSPKSYFSPYQNPFLENGPKGEYLTDRLTDHAVKFIEQNAEEPFFLCLSHYAVHTPLQAKPELVEKYESKPADECHDHAVYAAMIESMDKSVARVLDTLDRLELANNTLVIFYSDNGGYGPATCMDPLRGVKGMLYEGGIRVPLVMRWPGRIPAGKVSDAPVITVDLYPTLLEVCGIEPSPDWMLDGVSLYKHISTGTEIGDRALYWHFPAYLQAYGGGGTLANDPGFSDTGSKLQIDRVL